MVPQLDSVFEFNFNDNYGLDSIVESNCDTIQLWYYNVTLYIYIYSEKHSINIVEEHT